VNLLNSLDNVSQEYDYMITMIPTNKILREILFTKDNLSARLPDKCLMIDCSTISPLEVLAINEELQQKRNMQFIDAPVSGAVPGATNGTLTFMIGSTEGEQFEVNI
jgi:3-hydroxyisobutyrate dehydrogenase